jgi:hypothetical protein
MLQNWIRPLNEVQYRDFTQIENTICSKTTFFNAQKSIPNKSIVFVGLNAVAAQKIRKQLYQFQPTTNPIEITDLGQIRNRSEDFLTGLLSELQESQIKAILFGSAGQILNAQIQTLRALENGSKFCLVDPAPKAESMTKRNFDSLNKLVLIGTQKHLFQKQSWKDQEALEAINMGTLKNELIEAEPALRDSRAVSFSVEAINKIEAPGQRGNSNSKLTAYEACQLMHYLGFNRDLNSLAFTGYLPEFDKHDITANLIAQLIWYYLDAASMSVPDSPVKGNNTQSFSVILDQLDLNISFVKSLSSGKWWIQTPVGDYVSCSEKDYQLACSNKLSPRLSNIFT